MNLSQYNLGNKKHSFVSLNMTDLKTNVVNSMRPSSSQNLGNTKNYDNFLYNYKPLPSRQSFSRGSLNLNLNNNNNNNSTSQRTNRNNL